MIYVARYNKLCLALWNFYNLSIWERKKLLHTRSRKPKVTQKNKKKVIKIAMGGKNVLKALQKIFIIISIFFWSVLIIYCFSRKVFISLKLSFVWFTPDRGNWKNLISWELWFPKKITVFNVHSKDRLSLSGYEILFNQMNQSKLKLTTQQTKVKSPLICTTMANFIKKILI